jgi:hypothetical protein
MDQLFSGELHFLGINLAEIWFEVKGNGERIIKGKNYHIFLTNELFCGIIY